MAKAGSLELREHFVNSIKRCNGNAEQLQTLFVEADGTEGDKKSILEQAFRDVLRDLIVVSLDAVDVTPYTSLVQLSIDSAQAGICLHTVPFILLGDALDFVTINVCEKIFEFVESRVSTWTQPAFYSSGKILLLRMCNDLLRRLSSALNTVFCGRIQLFLARLFPLSEKSALNLMSHFNVDNVTTYNKSIGAGGEASDAQQKMEVDADGGYELGALIDYNLYYKLWTLQDFFRQPTQCYMPEQWKTFTASVQDVLQAFSSYKLEDVGSHSSRKRKRERGRGTEAHVGATQYSDSHYFAKFLTSEKLMNLQLMDSHFRRHILIQFLVLFQYLQGDVKFKSPTQVVTDVQSASIKELTEQVYKLLAETPPNGAEFTEYTKQLLRREENWIIWKNDGCPSFEKQILNRSEMERYPAKQHLGDTLRSSHKCDLGNRELSRLWNLCPNNMAACSSTSRMFVPDPEKFLQEAIEQADPEARIEAEYKALNNANFAWQCLRLLSLRSPHFFQNTTAQIRPLPEYLDHVVLQTGKELQPSVTAAPAPASTPASTAVPTPASTPASTAASTPVSTANGT
eukprot:Em0020g92a